MDDFREFFSGYEQTITELKMAIAQMQNQAQNFITQGRITDVDAKKGLARMEIANQNGESSKSAWVPYGGGGFHGPDKDGGSGQGGGSGGGSSGSSGSSSGQGSEQTETEQGWQEHRPVFKGQQVTLLSPAGEGRQAVMLPLGWSQNANSPSEKGDEHVGRWNGMKVTQKKDYHKIEVLDEADYKKSDQQGQGGQGGGSSGAQSGGGQSGGQKNDGKGASWEVKKGTVTTTVHDKVLTANKSAIWGKHKDDKNSFMVDDKHTHIRWGENSIWVDESGCWSSKPIQTKKCTDNHGSSGGGGSGGGG